jgi:hypothetical protein
MECALRDTYTIEGDKVPMNKAGGIISAKDVEDAIRSTLGGLLSVDATGRVD